MDRGFRDGDALGAVAVGVGCWRRSVLVLGKVCVRGVIVGDRGCSREGERLLWWSGVHGGDYGVVGGFGS